MHTYIYSNPGCHCIDDAAQLWRCKRCVTVALQCGAFESWRETCTCLEVHYSRFENPFVEMCHRHFVLWWLTVIITQHTCNVTRHIWHIFWLNCQVYVSGVSDLSATWNLSSKVFEQFAVTDIVCTITHDHPRSPTISATSRAISLRSSHDFNIFRSQLHVGRNMVVSPVWLGL